MTNMVITRADAIEAIEFLPPYREYWKGTRKILYAKEDIIKALNEVPSADRPHGKWFDRPKGYYCSVCGKWCDRGTHNFCPNCGKRMDTVERG